MRASALAAAAVLLLACAGGAAAQEERQCDLVESGRIEGFGRGETATIVLHDPFVMRCTDGAVLRAQTGTLNQAIRELHLLGAVSFQDAERTLTSDEATYGSQTGRLWARGDVVFVSRNEGSTLRGPELEYYRAQDDRPVSQVIATGRPHLTLRDEEAGPDEAPLEMDADRIVILGEDQLDGAGDVVIVRDSLTATGEAVRYEGSTGRLELTGAAEVVSAGYRLRGDVVRALLPEEGLENVTAEGGSELTSEELTLTAPRIELFFAEELLQRTVARGDSTGPEPQRAVALAEAFRLEADSLDALLPGQRLERVVAIGRAFGERFDTARTAAADSALAAAAPDSLTPAPGDTLVDGGRVPTHQRAGAAVAARDWIRGDTVIGIFETADTATADGAPADSATVLRTMVARGAAMSLYRLESREEEDGPGEEEPAPGTPRPARGPAINFLSGDAITLNLEGGEVQSAEVQGVRRGLYLEPAPPEDAAEDETEEPPPEAQPPGGPPNPGGVP